LNDNLSEFHKYNVRLLSISTDSKNHLKEFQEANNIKYILISDRGAKLANKFNVDIFAKGAGKKIKFKQAIPSIYLINKNQEIVWSFIAKDKKDRPKIKEILSAIKNNL
jgi:peroxiredoxin